MTKTQCCCSYSRRSSCSPEKSRLNACPIQPIFPRCHGRGHVSLCIILLSACRSITLQLVCLSAGVSPPTRARLSLADGGLTRPVPSLKVTRRTNGTGGHLNGSKHPGLFIVSATRYTHTHALVPDKHPIKQLLTLRSTSRFNDPSTIRARAHIQADIQKQTAAFFRTSAQDNLLPELILAIWLSKLVRDWNSFCLFQS